MSSLLGESGASYTIVDKNYIRQELEKIKLLAKAYKWKQNRLGSGISRPHNGSDSDDSDDVHHSITETLAPVLSDPETRP